MKINLSNIFEMQAKLDATIQQAHNVTYESVYDKIKLALLVELCELANEVRFFKFWSNKKPSNRSIVLEEYVDGIHFICSLAIAKDASKEFELNNSYELASKEELTDIFLNLSSDIKYLDSIEKINEWFKRYLILGIKLGFSVDEIAHSYIDKNKINFKRQENNY